MKKFAGLSLLLAGCFLSAQAGEATRAAAVKKLAQDMGKFTIEGDYAKVIDHTYDPLVKLLGGREQAIKITEKAMEKVKAQGITVKSFDVSDPGAFHSEGGNTFVVVPTRLEMTIPGGRLLSNSYLLGISADDSKTWKFVDGGSMDNKAIRDKVLPKLPEKLKLPAKENPTVIKN